MKIKKDLIYCKLCQIFLDFWKISLEKIDIFFFFSYTYNNKGDYSMRKGYKISLLVIAVFITLLVCIYADYQKFQGEEKDISAFIKVAEGLSINYLNGTSVNVDSASKEVAFSITNQLEETLYYNVNILSITGEVAGATYRLSSNVTDEVIQNVHAGSLLSRVAIAPGDTHRYTMNVFRDGNNSFAFEIEIVPEIVENSFANTILNLNEVKESPLSTFDAGASENEGLIKIASDGGDTYYFRGSVNNNYVTFAGNMWRIVKINANQTVQLVLNSTTENMVPMNLEQYRGNTDFLSSNVYQNLNNFYETYLRTYDNSIASTTYCFDNSVTTNEAGQLDYLSNTRLFVDYLPNLVCGGIEVTSKIALLTADEVMMAGGSSNANANYYLYIDGLQAPWWTMTPNKSENGELSYMVVAQDGSLVKDYSETSNLFLRPTITLTRRTTATGTGTLEDPFVLQ